jgi:hypothetical protein
LKELIGSGSWMQFYADDSGILKGIEEIIKHNKICESLEYSVERMLKSVAHSHNQYILGINTPFELIMSAASKEQAALIWKIDPVRIELVEEDTSMFDSISSKVFKAKAAEYFIPSGDPDYSSSDSESEEEFSETLFANKLINKQLGHLLSNPSDLKQYDKEFLSNAMQDLKLAEEFVPNITKSTLESMSEHYGFMRELIGIKNPKQELEKIKKSEQEEAKIQPVLKDLVQNISNQQIFTADMQDFANQQSYNIQTQENKSNDQNWLNDILSHTQAAMKQAYSDSDMQEFLKTLGGNSGFNFEDNV